MIKQKILFFILLFLLLINCSNIVGTKKTLKLKTNNIIIGFYNWNENGDSINDTIIKLNKKSIINNIFDGITNKRSPFYKCGYQGYINFYNNDKLLIENAEFNYNCGHIVFYNKNTSYCLKLSNNMKNYLEKLHK